MIGKAERTEAVGKARPQRSEPCWTEGRPEAARGTRIQLQDPQAETLGDCPDFCLGDSDSQTGGNPGIAGDASVEK